MKRKVSGWCVKSRFEQPKSCFDTSHSIGNSISLAFPLVLRKLNLTVFRVLVVEMEALKYAPSWGLRHRRDSVSGLSVHSQPFGYGGMASPAPTYHSQGKQLQPAKQLTFHLKIKLLCRRIKLSWCRNRLNTRGSRCRKNSRWVAHESCQSFDWWEVMDGQRVQHEGSARAWRS